MCVCVQVALHLLPFLSLSLSLIPASRRYTPALSQEIESQRAKGQERASLPACMPVVQDDDEALLMTRGRGRGRERARVVQMISFLTHTHTENPDNRGTACLPACMFVYSRGKEGVFSLRLISHPGTRVARLTS